MMEPIEDYCIRAGLVHPWASQAGHKIKALQKQIHELKGEVMEDKQPGRDTWDTIGTQSVNDLGQIWLRAKMPDLNQSLLPALNKYVSMQCWNGDVLVLCQQIQHFPSGTVTVEPISHERLQSIVIREDNEGTVGQSGDAGTQTASLDDVQLAETD